MLRALVTVTAVILGSLVSSPAAASDDDPIALELPEPSGPHRIGVTTLHLVDEQRDDPWTETSDARELMATVFYPTSRTHHYPNAPQFSPLAAEVFASFDTVFLHPQLPDTGVAWGATMTHAHAGAPVKPGQRPVLLYSPGGVDPRTLGTGMAEELASHGYVVVTVDHPGETSEVEFPGGRVRTYDLPAPPDKSPQVYRTMLRTRVADLKLTIDALHEIAAGENPDAESRPLPRHLAEAIDLDRIGAYGHSVGGAAVSEVLYEDDRIDMAVNMEGYLDYQAIEPGEPDELLPVAEYGVDKPLLLLGTEGFRDDRLERTWSMMARRENVAWRQVDDAEHWVFTDYGALVPQLHDAGLITAGERRDMVGTIPPEVSVPRIRRLLVGFFGRRHRPAPPHLTSRFEGLLSVPGRSDRPEPIKSGRRGDAQ